MKLQCYPYAIAYRAYATKTRAPLWLRALADICGPDIRIHRGFMWKPGHPKMQFATLTQEAT